MKRFLMTQIVGCLSGLITLGCDQSEPIPLPKQIDARIVPSDQGAPPVRDMQVDLDEAVAPPEDMTVPPMDIGVPDYVMDIDPSVVPSSNEYVIVGGGDQTHMVWWRGGRIFSRVFTAQIMVEDGDGPPELMPIDPERVDIVAGPVVELGYYPPYAGSMLGSRAPNSAGGHPGFAFIPSEDEGWQALDLQSDDLSLFPLGLYGPVQVGSRSAGASSVDQILVLGRSEPTADAPLAQVVLSDSLESTPVIGARNRLLPVSITTSGGDWMMAYEDGICVTLAHTETGPGEELGSWPCGSGPGAQLIGRGVMTGLEAGVYGAGQTESELLVWDPRAGEHVNPGILTMLTDMPEPPMDPEDVDPAPAADGGLDMGSPDMQLSDAGPLPDAQVDADSALPEDEEENEPSPIRVVRNTSSAIHWLNRVPLGRALQLENGDTYLLTENQIVLLTPPERDSSLGVIHATGGALFRIVWSDDGEPIIERSRALDTMLPPRSGDTVCPGRVPDSCDFDDHDCDGFGRSYMCCPFSFDYDDLPLNSTEPLDGSWLVVQGDEGPITAVAYPQQGELHNMVGGAQSCLGCWPAASEFTHLTRAGAVMVMAGHAVGDGSEHTCPATCATAVPLNMEASDEPEDEMAESDAGMVDADMGIGNADAQSPSEGDGGDTPEAPPPPPPTAPALFWHLAPNVVETTAAPCDRVWHLESVREIGGAHVRVYCADRRYDYRIQGGVLSDEITTSEYAFGAAHWFGPPVKRREGGVDVTYLLSASGPDFELNLMRITPEEDTVTELGAENAAVQDRTHPFRPSISNTMRPARIIDDRFVDIHINGQGWYRAPSRRFARKAHFSAHDHYAVTVAEELDRNAEGYDSVRQALLFYLHDLQVGGNHWGKPLQVRSSAVLDHSFHGISLADFPESDNERTLWIGIGRARAPVVLSGFALKCRANSDQ